MSEENEKENKDSEENLSDKAENEIKPEEDQKQKQKFVFNCTKCGYCCEHRGPIPITFWDLQNWAKNNVVNNFLPYLKIYRNAKGFFDIILAPLKFQTNSMPKTEKEENSKDKESKEPDIDEIRCALYNIEKKECLVYNYRPLSCRTYPLEFDGQKYQVVDTDTCQGIGNGEMSKEERIKMRDGANLMYSELINMRISIPVLYPVIQKDVFEQLVKIQEEATKNLSEDDRRKLEEIYKKGASSENEPKQ